MCRLWVFMYLYPKTPFEMKPTNKSKSSIDQRAKAKTPNNLSQQQHQHPLLTHMTYAYSAVHFGHHTMQHASRPVSVCVCVCGGVAAVRV